MSELNCSTINITWNAPTGVSIHYYNILVYHENNGDILSTASVYNTSYQFINHDVFIYHLTYLITAVSELGEGVRKRATFSYRKGTFKRKLRYLLYAFRHKINFSYRSSTEYCNV